MKILRIKVFTLLVILPVVGAQSSNITKLPQCAFNCFTQAVANGPCGGSNTTCMCTNDIFIAESGRCIVDNCTVVEALRAKNLALQDCGIPPRNRTGRFGIATSFLSIFSGLLVIQRFVSKILWKLNIGLDDWFTLATYACALAVQCIIMFGSIPNGMGRDVWTLPPSNITAFLKYLWYTEILYYVQVPLMKNAMLFLYLRVFTSKYVRRIFWVTIAFNSITGLPFIFLATFQCTPRSHFWTSWFEKSDGYCMDYNAVAWSNAALSIALGIWMIILPLSQLQSLGLDWKKKIGVGMMFSVGIFVTIISVVRLQALVSFSEDTDNPSWDFLNVAVWSIIEMDVAIICACMPALRVTLVRILPRIGGAPNPEMIIKRVSGDSSTRARGTSVQSA